MTLHDPFSRTRLPAASTREDRVRLVGEAAEALLHGRLPDAPARLFLAGAISAWLARGGDLEPTICKLPRRLART